MRPKKILFTTLGSLGDLFPYLAVASEMQSRGYLATILTTTQHRSRVEQSGLQFRKCGLLKGSGVPFSTSYLVGLPR